MRHGRRSASSPCRGFRTLHGVPRKVLGWIAARPYAKPDGSQLWVKIVDFRDKRTAAQFQEMAVAAAVAAFERIREAA